MCQAARADIETGKCHILFLIKKENWLILHAVQTKLHKSLVTTISELDLTSWQMLAPAPKTYKPTSTRMTQMTTIFSGMTGNVFRWNLLLLLLAFLIHQICPKYNLFAMSALGKVPSHRGRRIVMG